MPTIIIEDGTLVSGANSYIDSAYVDAYATARNLTDWDVSGTQSRKDAAILEASDYLKNEVRYNYRGARRTATQITAWPRDGASEYRGPALPNDYISWRLKESEAKLSVRAYAAPGTLQPAQDRGGATKFEKVDVIETTYMDNAPTEVVIQEVWGLLAPLCVTLASTLAMPYIAEPIDPADYTAGAFNNPPTPVT